MRRSLVLAALVVAVSALGATVAWATMGAPPSAGQEWIVSGRVSGVDQASKVISLMNTSTVVTFSDETTIYGARERAYITPYDISRRDIIHVAGTSSEPGTVAATWINVIHPPAMVTGRIVSIDRDAKTITVYKNKIWPAVIVNYLDSTKVKVPGRLGLRTPNILEPGMRIKVHGYRKGTDIYAGWIKVLRWRSRHQAGTTAAVRGRRGAG